MEGSRALYAYCEEHGIATEHCGKVVVATDERDLARLDDIHARARARANAVQGVLGEEDLREVEPAGGESVPSTRPGRGIVDFRQVASALAAEIVRLGATIRFRSAVHGITRSGHGTVRLALFGSVEARVVITCAGAPLGPSGADDRRSGLAADRAVPRAIPRPPAEAAPSLRYQTA